MEKEKKSKIIFMSSVVAIAILATVGTSLGVYFGTRVAPVDNIDQAKVDELNKVLAQDEETNGKNEVVGQAIGDFKLNGVSSYLPFGSENNFYWIQSENRIVNLHNKNGVTYPIEAKSKYSNVNETSVPLDWFDLSEGCDHHWGLSETKEYQCEYCKEIEDTPQLNVSYEQNIAPSSKLSIEDFGGGKHPELKIDSIAFKYTFEAVDTIKTAQDRGIDNYYVDFIVSLHRKDNNYQIDANETPVAAKKSSIGLWGSFGTLESAFYLPYDMQPGQTMTLLSTLDKDYMWSYSLLVGLVGQFSCGAFNCDASNEGLTIKAELCMWDKSKITNNKLPLHQISPDIEVGAWEHTFTSDVNVSQK